MKLSAVTSGRIDAPLYVIMFGPEGIGKTTFGACAPSPVFICAENGTEELNIQRFPEPRTWSEVLEALDELIHGEHAHKTLVIDTLDWVEPLIWAHICERDGKANVAAYGYGKGYDAALEEWRVLAARLAELRAKRGMHIVLLAHAVVKTFQNPEADDYDRYQLKLHMKAAALFREACSAVLFAKEEVAVLEKDNARSKAISTGKRIIYTTRTAAYDAKNRYNLPASIPLDWQAFEMGVRSGRALADEVDRLVARVQAIDPGVADAAREWVRSKPRTLEELGAVKERLLKRLSPQAEPETTTNSTDDTKGK